MKKLHQFIIKAYLIPFAATFFITLFILVMQFLWKYIDELVGKGLEWYVIFELLFYASANLVPLALPLAILLSSIMTMGNLGENYELTAMKSAGISLQRILFPLFLVIVLTSGCAFYFTNNIWPVANLKMAALIYDVRQKKPALDIREKVYYYGIDNFVIRTEEKSKDGQWLHNVLIYDHSDGEGNTKVIRADKGKMALSQDKRYLILTLFDGNSYEDVVDNEKKKQMSHPMLRTSFAKETVRMNLEGFELERSDEDLFKDNYKMLNLSQIVSAIDTLKVKLEKRKEDYRDYILKKNTILKDSSINDLALADSLQHDSVFFYNKMSVKERVKLIEAAINLTRNTKTYTNSLQQEFDLREGYIKRHKIEWHRKFTLSVACIVLFLIGAPLGAIIRKGGLGMPVVVSVIFFLIFHILSITGEKIVKETATSVITGMWLATFVLAPIGLFLTYKATTDSALLSTEAYTSILKRIKSKMSNKG